MSREVSPTSRVAYCEEVNDDDEVTSRRTYAKSVMAGSPPPKERSNTGRSRKGPSRHSPTSPPSSYDDMSDTGAASAARREAKSRPKESRKNSKSGPVVVSKHIQPKRPGVRQSKTTGHIPARSIDEASYYGVPNHPQTIVSRPRSKTRPESYYGQTARQLQRPPPMSQSAFYNPPPGPGPFAPQPFGPPGMFNGPPHMSLPMHPGPPGPPGPPHGPPPPLDYPHGPLSARFGRPQSAMGMRPPPSYEPEPIPDRTVARKASVNRKPSNQYDERMRMPPPARPASARPSVSGGDRLVFKAPAPQQIARSKSKRQIMDEGNGDDYDEEDELVYRPPNARRISTSTGYAPSANPFASRRRESFDAESDLDLAIYKKEPVSGHARRRSSVFHSAIDEKTRRAMTYQDGVLNHGAPLTADALKYIKNGGSTRSTRSTESRDESDWKHSATTRTTRSSNEDDDITIKLPKGGIIEVGGAKITCANGGDVNIGRGNRHGSDHATERDTATIQDDEDDDEEDEDDDDYYDEPVQPKSRGMRIQKRIQAAEPYVGSYPHQRDPRTLQHPQALAQHPYSHYAPSSYGSGRHTPGPRGGAQTGVYDPYPHPDMGYAPTFHPDDDEDEYDEYDHYPPPRPGMRYGQQPRYAYH